ncbi:TPA: RES family NAD+ phosphorylase [Pseudomonas aeruginosa]
MKIIGVQDLPCYRMHTPKWSVAPTSGAGAATQGGRVNRKGLEALYLSLDSATAIAEFQQASAFLPPGLLVSYSLSLDRVIDFTGGYNDTWAPIWQDFFCDWRKIRFNDGVEPPSWIIGDLAIEADCAGILFESVANPGGRNLVLFTDQLPVHGNIVVNDPRGDLPTDQSSWTRP